jgi:hypothetical protein
MKHRTLTALGLTAAIAVGGAAGATLGVPSIVSAQEDTSSTTEAPAPTDPSGPVAVEGERPGRSAWLAEALAPLVSDGTITQAQADAVVAALDAAKPERGPGGPGGHHGRGHRGGQAAAEALGMTTDELRTELESGKTLGQVADERGVDRQALVDAMVADLKTHLDEEVAAGEHTQEEADQKLADATQRITESLDKTKPEGGPRGPRGPRG